MNTRFKESRRRSIMKGLTWRCLATATTYLIALLWTGETGTAGKIALAEFFIKFGVYYLHERAWQWSPGNKLVAENLESDSAESVKSQEAA